MLFKEMSDAEEEVTVVLKKKEVIFLAAAVETWVTVYNQGGIPEMEPEAFEETAVIIDGVASKLVNSVT